MERWNQWLGAAVCAVLSASCAAGCDGGGGGLVEEERNGPLERPGDAQSVTPGPAQAGSCTGSRTRCEPFGVETVDVTPARCTVQVAQPTIALWSTDIGDMDCPIGRCRLADPELAIAPDGSFWVVADLYPMQPEELTGALGVGVKHFDGAGKELAAAVLSVRERFAPLSADKAAALRADEQGGLTVVKHPTSGIVEIVKFDTAARAGGGRTLVAEARAAAGQIAEDDSVLLAYVYDEEDPAAGSAKNFLNAAKSNAAGHVLWNQNLVSAVTGSQAPPGSLGSGNMPAVQMIGTDDGGAVVRVSNPRVDGEERDELLIRLDTEGSVLWARNFVETHRAQLVALPNGGVAVARISFEGEPRIEEMNAGGTVTVSTVVPSLSLRQEDPAPTPYIAGTDGLGRILTQGIIPAQPGDSTTASKRLLGIVSRGGAVCSVSALDIAAQEPASIEGLLRVHPSGSTLLFTTRRSVGALQLPEVQ